MRHRTKLRGILANEPNRILVAKDQWKLLAEERLALQCSPKAALCKFLYFSIYIRGTDRSGLVTYRLVQCTHRFNLLGMIMVAVDAMSVMPAELIDQKRLQQLARVKDASAIEDCAHCTFKLFILSTALFILFFRILNPLNAGDSLAFGAAQGR